MSKKEAYVYVLFRPNGVPCYIGKGKKDRWLAHERFEGTNEHLHRIIRKTGGTLPKVKIRENLTDRQAYQVERALIKVLGRVADGSGILVNLAPGGKGGEGHRWSKKQRAALSKRRLGRKHSEETKAKISAALKGRKFSKATRLRMSYGQMGKPMSEEAKQKIGNFWRGKKHTEAHKAAAAAGRQAMTKAAYKRMCKRISQNKKAQFKIRKQALADARKQIQQQLLTV